MKLRYERGALADLEEIFAYIAADTPRAAARLVARIETTAKRIAEAPYIGEATRRSRFTMPKGWKISETVRRIAGLPHQIHIAMQHNGL